MVVIGVRHLACKMSASGKGQDAKDRSISGGALIGIHLLVKQLWQPSHWALVRWTLLLPQNLLLGNPFYWKQKLASNWLVTGSGAVTSH